MDIYENVEVNSPRWLSLKDLKNEEWKWIPNCEGYFLISNYGRIKRLKTNYLSRGINKSHLKDHILRLNKSDKKYRYVKTHISLHGKKRKVLPHRLVAELFIPNPLNLPEVNHKDENYHNPRVDNLEWCTHKYNLNYGTIRERWKKSYLESACKKVVYQYTKTGIYIRSYKSIEEAGNTLNISPSMIGEVCSERRNVYSAGGYIWTFSQDKYDIKRKIVRVNRKRTNVFKNTKEKSHKKGRKKSVIQCSIIGEYIATYNSITEAAKNNNVSINAIQNCLQGRSKTAGKYIWKYVQ